MTLDGTGQQEAIMTMALLAAVKDLVLVSFAHCDRQVGASNSIA
jgi:hypothetical protein